MNYYLLKFAQTISAGEAGVPELDDQQVVQNILNTTYFVAGITTIIVIIVGAIMYVVSSGNASSITKAKNMILFAVIGLVLVLSAYAITSFVFERFR